jgi:Tfp pilus assembly protein PilV
MQVPAAPAEGWAEPIGGWFVSKNARRALGPRCVRRARSGFTLIEIALTTTVLLVALVSTSASVFSLHALRRQSRERSIAHNAVQIRSERVHAAARAAIHQTGSWATHVVSSQCPAGTLEADFDVEGLTPQDGEAHVGKIVFVVDETLSDADLGVSLGLPRDLDGDGAIWNHDVSARARILPVLVSARWKGVRGNAQIVHPFVAIGY